jgi:type IV secretion system protein VirB9
MKRSGLCCLGASFCIAAAVAPSVATAQVLTRYQFKPDSIYPVNTGLGITTQIELSPNEKVLDYSTGFSGGWDLTRRDGVQYKITFTYPADTSFAHQKKKQLQATAQNSALLPDRSYNFNYDYATRSKAAPWLVPANVYDDGRFTYIRMSDLNAFPTGDFPAVYMREQEEGEDSLVNTTVEGNTIVVHGTYSYLVIRHGNDVVGLRRNTRK